MRYIQFYQKNDKKCHHAVPNNGREEMEGQKAAISICAQRQNAGSGQPALSKSWLVFGSIHMEF